MTIRVPGTQVPNDMLTEFGITRNTNNLDLQGADGRYLGVIGNEHYGNVVTDWFISLIDNGSI